MKTFYFIAGLPRSGSTLLCNILNQNPNFYATSTSGVPNIIKGIRDTWDTVIEFKATPHPEAKLNILKAIIPTFYKNIDKEVIFDKSRMWPSMIEILECILERDVKIIATVRDIRDIIASFEMIWRKDSKSRLIPQEKDHPIQFQTLKGRIETWVAPEQPIGSAFAQLTDAYNRGLGNRIMLVDYDFLTSYPKEAMKDIYEFIGQKFYTHNFNNVIQTTRENDSFYGFNDLHTIRKKVESKPSQWLSVIGKEYEYLDRYNFWKKDNPNRFSL